MNPRFLNSNPEIQKLKLQKLVSLLLAWYPKNARALPWRRTRDPYAIWVSEIMLQQTQVITVLPFWERWMRELPTIQSAARASSQKILKLWEGLGYYTRVRNLQKAAQIIMTQHKGRLPRRFEDILALPGIGRYTAGAISSISFNEATPILDGNVVRVLTRIFGIAENPREPRTNQRLWRIAEALVVHAKSNTRNSKFACSRLNQSLMELGALVCTPRNPQCNACPITRLCVAFKTRRTAELPNLGKREKATARRFVAFVLEHRGKFLVRQRPDRVVNAHLWEFPNLEFDGPPSDAAGMFKSHFGIAPPPLEPLPPIKHSITRYRITLEPFRGRLMTPLKTSQAVWMPKAKLDSMPFTSAHRKILAAL